MPYIFALPLALMSLMNIFYMFFFFFFTFIEGQLANKIVHIESLQRDGLVYTYVMKLPLSSQLKHLLLHIVTIFFVCGENA